MLEVEAEAAEVALKLTASKTLLLRPLRDQLGSQRGKWGFREAILVIREAIWGLTEAFGGSGRLLVLRLVLPEPGGSLGALRKSF